jgi:hypothetical protein
VDKVWNKIDKFDAEYELEKEEFEYHSANPIFKEEKTEKSNLTMANIAALFSK